MIFNLKKLMIFLRQVLTTPVDYRDITRNALF
jgi:hypothetical protein